MLLTLLRPLNSWPSGSVAHGRRSRPPNCRERPRCRPDLELLEDRLAPAVSGPPFDFSNSFYLANGIDPSKILNRVGTANSASAFVVDNSNTNPDRNNIRITETTGGFDNAGTPLFYTINGFVNPDTFTNDEAGQQARKIAEKFEAYILPKASGGTLTPSLSNRRQ